MPLVPILIGMSVFFAGAFAGSQVDDAIDQAPQSTPITQAVNPTKIMLYGAGALALYWGMKQTGIIRK